MWLSLNTEYADRWCSSHLAAISAMSRQEHQRAPGTTFGLANESANKLVETKGRGTVADLLVEAHPCCGFHAKRSVGRFRRLGARKHGLWFDAVLDSQPEELTLDDARYILGTWEQWLTGEVPFRLRGHRVTA